MKKRKQYRNDTYIRYRKYANEWIALTDDESTLLGHSRNILRLHDAVAQKERVKGARFIHILPPNTNFAF